MKSPNKTLSKSIKNLLQDQYYVPVLRDEDNCLSPQIGPPWSSSKDGPVLFTSSPLSPTFRVSVLLQ